VSISPRRLARAHPEEALGQLFQPLVTVLTRFLE
jgi:hypothetical protein